MAKYGDMISKLRDQHGLTQEELAKKVGISRAALSHYEKNRREPDYATLERLADYFDVTIDYLFGRPKKLNITKYQEAGVSDEEYSNLSSYQKEVLDYFLNMDRLAFKEHPENLLDALEQFEVYYEVFKKQQARKK